MTTAITRPVGAPLRQRLAAALVALALGGIFLYGAGFAPMPALHDVAHDGRHAFAFPCH